MKTYEELTYRSHIFLISALVGGEWSASHPGTHWMGGWVGPRADLDDVEERKFVILLGLELRLLGRPACNQSLYRLQYSAYLLCEEKEKNIIAFFFWTCY
jgi:hypothetical protein